MFGSLGFLFLMIFTILPSNGHNRSIAEQELSLCINDIYRIPLFTTRFLRMTLNRTRLNQLNIHTIRLHALIVNKNVAEFGNHLNSINRIFYIKNTSKYYNNQSLMYVNLKIYTKYMNQTNIYYFIRTNNTKNQIHSFNCSLILMVSQPLRLKDKIFKYSIPFIVIFVSIQMGILLDREVLKELIRQPTQIFMGFVSQYAFMPIIAFSITKIFRYDPLHGFALFVLGCCPGGTASNQWTVIFDGDLNLSVIMSFASTVASFFMMPLWLYTLGQHAYLTQLKLRIPYLNLAQSLFTIIVPTGIGMILRYFFPKLQPIVQRILKLLLVILLSYFTILACMVNFYLLEYVSLMQAVTGTLLPWLGFLLGGFFAWICRQDWKRIVTIGIETGIQNYTIAFMVLLYSLPSPENSQTIIIPFIVGFLSTQPFNLLLLYQLVCTKCFNKPKPVSHMSNDTMSKTTWHLSEAEAESIEV